MKPPKADTLRGAWYYIYGKGSHMNLAGKLILGVPLFPFIALAALLCLVFDSLFTKGQQ
jgi:hypothetical protein